MAAIQIAYLEVNDLDEAYQISLEAFRQDAHTLFKMHEKGSTDMQSEMLPKAEIRSYLDRPEKVKVIKAIIEDRIVGFSIWGLWNWTGQNKEETAKDPEAQMTDAVEPAYSSTDTALEQLNSITSGHLSVTLDRACQPAHPTIYCIGFHVAPGSQGLGVGTSMVRWATDLAESQHAAGWAHLSDNVGGIKAFERNGFKEVNTVTVDLDKYASKKTSRAWGQYSQHCMYRPPNV